MKLKLTESKLRSIIKEELISLEGDELPMEVVENIQKGTIIIRDKARKAVEGMMQKLFKENGYAYDISDARDVLSYLADEIDLTIDPWGFD